MPSVRLDSLDLRKGCYHIVMISEWHHWTYRNNAFGGDLITMNFSGMQLSRKFSLILLRRHVFCYEIYQKWVVHHLGKLYWNDNMTQGVGLACTTHLNQHASVTVTNTTILGRFTDKHRRALERTRWLINGSLSLFLGQHWTTPASFADTVSWVRNRLLPSLIHCILEDLLLIAA